MLNSVKFEILLRNMKIKFEIEYDGMKFCGWQKQEGVVTVQEVLEKAMTNVFGNKEIVTLYGSGRTDAGVHAISQVAHIEIFDEKLIKKWINNISKMSLAINFYLHDTGAVVKSSEIVSDDFHARFSAKQRAYLYVIFNRKIESILLKNRVWHVKKKLDAKIMHDAGQLFLGTHNFNAFRSTDCQSLTAVRTVDFLSVLRKKDIILINIKAKSFLHNQVRIMVGTLKQIGLGKMQKFDIKTLLISGDRTKAGLTAPPYGLYFQKVLYPDIDE